MPKEDFAHRLFSRIPTYLWRLPWSGMIGLCTVLVLLIGGGDYLTGTDLSFSLFYLLPILIASWFLGIREGLFFSLLSCGAWLFTDSLLTGRFNTLTHYWNAFGTTGTFFIVSGMACSLKNALAAEREAARVDPLTGIPNRRAFYEAARAEVLRAQRYKNPLTIAYIDVDRFKGVNDTDGHEKGDIILMAIGKAIKSNLRATDVAARFGGDEFVLLLPYNDASASETAVSKMTDSLLSLAQSYKWPIGFSVGAVTYLAAPENVDEMLKRADQLMYQVKKDGGSSVRHEIVQDLN